MSRQTAHKWLNRFEEAGDAGLEDRSCRPKSLPSRTARKLVRRMVQLRRRRKAGWEIARELDVPVSTVSKHLKAEGVGRIWRLEEEADPPRRYEHAAPGDLLHIDAKKLARIEAVGHRIHGDRSRRRYGAGYEVVFVCVDDHTRLAYAEVYPSENAKCATAFFRRALRWFESLGIRCRRVLSDNAKCYDSDLPASTGPGLELVYAASWFMAGYDDFRCGRPITQRAVWTDRVVVDGRTVTEDTEKERKSAA